MYRNVQMMYYMNITKAELESMDDEVWSATYAILTDIRQAEAKQNS